MVSIKRYAETDKEAWNRYVAKARNATFLFDRNYIDYHKERFDDHSLLFYRNGKLHALLPAHQQETTFYSHRGLTYGGLIVDNAVTAADTLELFEALNRYLKAAGITKVVYRPIPWIYHTLPAEEDLYAIFWKCNARLSLRNIGTTIVMRQNPAWRKDHRRRLKQAEANGVTVVRDDSLDRFWPILESNLQHRYHARPVHSLQEIKLLKSRFPRNIIQYNAYRNEKIIGGITFYITSQVIHGQYSATDDDGKRYGAMEMIYNRVMYHDYPDMPYLDFGSSTEQQGAWLNTGLIAHKEGYGGRAVCYDTYEWEP